VDDVVTVAVHQAQIVVGVGFVVSLIPVMGYWQISAASAKIVSGFSLERNG
jgi:hypothetical protein